MLWAGDLDSVAVLASETGRLADQQSQAMWRATAELELTLVTALRGDYAQAKERAQPCLASPENRDARLYRVMAHYGLSVAAPGVGSGGLYPVYPHDGDQVPFDLVQHPVRAGAQPAIGAADERARRRRIVS